MKRENFIPKKKIHMSTTNLLKQDLFTDENSNKKELVNTATLNKFDMSSQKLPKIQNLTIESKFLKSFYMKKNFSNQSSVEKNMYFETSKELRLKNSSIWSEQNLKNWNSSLEKSSIEINFKRLHSLRQDKSCKCLERLITFDKLAKTLEKFFNKSLFKSIFIGELDQEIKGGISNLEESICLVLKEFSILYEKLLRESQEKSEKLFSLSNKFEELKSHFSTRINEYFMNINSSAEQQYKKVHNKTSLNEIYANIENQKLEKEIDILMNSLKAFEKSHNIDQVSQEFSEYRENSEKDREDLRQTIQKKDLLIFQITGQLSIRFLHKKIWNYLLRCFQNIK